MILSITARGHWLSICTTTLSVAPAISDAALALVNSLTWMVCRPSAKGVVSRKYPSQWLYQLSGAADPEEVAGLRCGGELEGAQAGAPLVIAPALGLDGAVDQDAVILRPQAPRLLMIDHHRQGAAEGRVLDLEEVAGIGGGVSRR